MGRHFLVIGLMISIFFGSCGVLTFADEPGTSETGLTSCSRKITFVNDTDEGTTLKFHYEVLYGWAWSADRLIPLKQGDQFVLHFPKYWNEKVVAVMCNERQSPGCVQHIEYRSTKVQSGETWNVSTLKENHTVVKKHNAKCCPVCRPTCCSSCSV